ncbi:hypothetical protein AWN68_14855 [Roseivirga echinicomitans]|uniref:Uncharacterized protein n=1 Tax=Roseivirga echinicomitans TaxID=296218 RepID=A0A150XUU6_9BACT|nr:hypothetical protein AWN68_14855 [Roseivirga echinicomitans]
MSSGLVAIIWVLSTVEYSLTAKHTKFREGGIGTYVGYVTKASFQVVANKLSHTVSILLRNRRRVVNIL